MTLELDAVSLAPRGGAPLFAPLSLSVRAGEVVTLMGPSGIGKSTLLDAIGGHLSAAFALSGDIRLNGESVIMRPPEARRIGLLFQDAALFPHLNVADNLAFGLSQNVKGAAARRDAVLQALHAARLDGFGDRDPATLSGGQRARVALMRALLAAPAALLLDEPFSSLDADRKAEVRDYVFDQIKQRAIPTLLVTHDPQDAESAGGATHMLAAS